MANRRLTDSEEDDLLAQTAVRKALSEKNLMQRYNIARPTLHAALKRARGRMTGTRKP